MDRKTIAKMKRQLLDAKQPIRGLSDAEIIEAHGKYCDPISEVVPINPKPETEPKQDTAKEAKPKKPVKPLSKGEQLEQLLSGLAMDESRVIELIKQHSNQVTHYIEHNDKETIVIDSAHKSFDPALECLQIARGTGSGWPYLVGPAGSGKTTLAKQLATAMDVEFYATESVSDKFELTGFVGADREYHSTPFYEAMKNGGVFLFDEIDRSASEATVAFNMALANGFFIFPNGERVTKHDDCYFIAGGNTKGHGATEQYPTAKPIDGATLDRFDYVHVDYDTELERQLAHSTALSFCEDYDVIKVDNWVDTVQSIRQAISANDLPVILSPRKTLSGAARVSRGYTVQTVIDQLIKPLMTEAQFKQVIRQISHAEAA